MTATPGVQNDHRAMLRTAVADAGGEEVDTQGDSSFFAFRGAREAISAAVAAQRAHAGHEWPPDGEVRVRMGIHTGEPVLAEDRYIGLDVHRAARICDAGHGGQVLISSDRPGAGRRRPARRASRVRDLGEHHLKRPRPAGAAAPAGDRRAGPASSPSRTRSAGTPAQSLRVVLADDSVLLREGVARLLEEADFEVVGQVDNADDLLRRIGFSKPDVAIVDIRMPPTHTDEGLQAAARDPRALPRRRRARALLLRRAVLRRRAAVATAPRASATCSRTGWPTWTSSPSAVRRVAQGGSALDPAVVRQLVGRPRGDDPLDELTPREREVLSLMAEGRSNAGIALHMVVTERAVEKHVTSIFQKLALPQATEDHRRVLAVLAYLRSWRPAANSPARIRSTMPRGLLADHRPVLQLEHRQLALAGSSSWTSARRFDHGAHWCLTIS